jgi:ABC-type uncharacterized transport system ATPase subunit
MINPPVAPTLEGGLNLNTGQVLVNEPVGDPVMRLKDVTVAFGGRKAVRGVSFDVHEGEITALIACTTRSGRLR